MLDQIRNAVVSGDGDPTVALVREALEAGGEDLTGLRVDQPPSGGPLPPHLQGDRELKPSSHGSHVPTGVSGRS